MLLRGVFVILIVVSQFALADKVHKGLSAERCIAFSSQDGQMSACEFGRFSVSTGSKGGMNPHVALGSLFLHWKSESELIFKSTKHVLEKKLCEIDYDIVGMFDFQKNSYKELWSSEKNSEAVIHNMGNVVKVKHSQDSSPQKLHACEPFFDILILKAVGKNIGVKYDKRLKPDNFIVVTRFQPTVYFFSANLKTLVNSFSFYDAEKVLSDAEITASGTLVAKTHNFRDKGITCVEEWDMVNSTEIFKKCDFSLASSRLYKADDHQVYVLRQDQGQGASLSRSLESFANFKAGGVNRFLGSGESFAFSSATRVFKNVRPKTL